MKSLPKLAAVAALATLVGIGMPLRAQTHANNAPMKIGYTDAELIVALLPEMNGVQQQLRTYEQSLSQVLNVKQSYYETKIKEYQERKAAGTLTAEEDARAVKELEQLGEELQKSQADAENKLSAKREELLKPLLEKAQNAITEVAKAEGYTYILNANIAGNSILLYVPEGEQHNITRAVLKKLNVEMPDSTATPGAPGGGTTPGGGTNATPGGNGGGTQAPGGPGGGTRPAPGTPAPGTGGTRPNNTGGTVPR